MPGALPAFNSVGTLTGSPFNGTGDEPANMPATVAVGDTVVLFAIFVGGSNRSLNSISTNAWTILTADAGGDAFPVQLGIAYRVVESAGEGGGSITMNITGTSSFFVAGIVRLTAADGFAATPIQALSSVQTQAAGTSVAMPTVDITGTNQRAFAFVLSNVPAAINAATGESNGDWGNTSFSDQDADVDYAFVLQTSDQSSGNDISGGTATWTGSGAAFSIGFAAVPSGDAARKIILTRPA